MHVGCKLHEPFDVGDLVGAAVDGAPVGLWVGKLVGANDGNAVGAPVGDAVVGSFVGASTKCGAGINNESDGTRGLSPAIMACVDKIPTCANGLIHLLRCNYPILIGHTLDSRLNRDPGAIQFSARAGEVFDIWFFTAQEFHAPELIGL